MYNLLAVLTGMIISVMIAINGGLTKGYGVYFAAVIIHVVGVLFALVLCFAGKRKIQIRSTAPKWAYLGGVIGVLTTFCNNCAYGKISMTSIVALGLLGQSVTSIVLDAHGFLGIPAQKMKKTAWIGFAPAVVGIFVMLDKSVSDSLTAVLISFAAGISIVLSRTVNARLSRETGPLNGSLINHLAGLPVCIILLQLFQKTIWTAPAGTKAWMYLGGTLGVITVLLLNIVVPKVTAFRLTLLSFIGQVFTGAAIDLLGGQKQLDASFAGGIIIAAGLILNILIEHWNHKKDYPDGAGF
ncbi:MAG: DMT family transporter [Butyrivibrio sp.]|nr:DMT family transporter [Butyrivibrio sp.]